MERARGRFSNLAVRLPPVVWLTLFFLLPFLLVLKVSLSESAIAQPPYRPVFNPASGFSGLVEMFGQFSLANYVSVFADDLLWGCLLYTSRCV